METIQSYNFPLNFKMDFKFCIYICLYFPVQRRKQDKPRVTMKIIDFANVSFPPGGEDETSSHQGPDDGFIMGLDNLYTILQTILEEDQFYL